LDHSNEAPIIIIKKKAGHGGHHGGAWKVAYADFVTAMMAFFMVMWLMNAGTKVKEAVAGYFNDPIGYKGKIGSGMGGTGDGIAVSKNDIPNLKEKLEQALKEMPNFKELKDNVKFTVTGEGLRIELLETENGMFFTSGSAAPSPQGIELLQKMAAELTRMENRVLIEGHTDAKPFTGQGYGNWELSVDRANSARRVMQNAGLPPDRVIQVRGFADQRLFKKDDPSHASNRRVSIIVHYKDQKDDPEVEIKGKDTPAADPAHGSSGHGADHAPASASGH
jgi:chemotaxis protein MotB